MVAPDPPCLLRSVGEVLGTCRLPNALTEILASRFLMLHEDGGGLWMKKHSVQGLHSFLAHLVLVVYLVPGLDHLCVLGINQDRMVHILHSLFSVTVKLYSTISCLFTFWVELPDEGLPLVVKMPVEAFVVRRSMRTVAQADHVSHLGGCLPAQLAGNSLRVGGEALDRKLQLGVQGVTLVFPDCNDWILGRAEEQIIDI